MRTPILPILLVACATATEPDKPATTSSTPTTTPAGTGPEVCDGIDNDGDGQVDEGVGDIWFADDDEDGFGDPDQTLQACEEPDGYVADDTDCDDDDLVVHPGASDLCDGIDTDCDEDIDEDHRPNWWLGTVGNDGWLYRIDLAAGTIVRETELSNFGGTINSVEVFEQSQAFGHIHNPPNQPLITFDACTGVITTIGPTGTNAVGGIAFSDTSDLLGLDHGDESLVEFDQSTGAATTLLQFPFDLGKGGMAYDCSTGTIYGVDANTDEVFVVDPTVPELRDFQLTNVPFDSVGLEWDQASGTLLAATAKQVYSIEPLTGATTLLAELDFTWDIDDLAYYPPCP